MLVILNIVGHDRRRLGLDRRYDNHDTYREIAIAQLNQINISTYFLRTSWGTLETCMYRILVG